MRPRFPQCWLSEAHGDVVIVFLLGGKLRQMWDLPGRRKALSLYLSQILSWGLSHPTCGDWEVCGMQTPSPILQTLLPVMHTPRSGFFLVSWWGQSRAGGTGSSCMIPGAIERCWQQEAMFSLLWDAEANGWVLCLHNVTVLSRTFPAQTPVYRSGNLSSLCFVFI